MAEQGILHTADIMKAALPYIDTKNKASLDFFMKIFDLMGSLKSFKSSPNVTASGFDVSKIDVEGLLNGIRPVCNNKEREIIDKILNFFNMKRAFEMYNKMSEMMKNMQDMGGFNFGDFNTGDGSSTTSDAETVAENFTGQNYDSIFKDTAENKVDDYSSFASDFLSDTDQSDFSSFTSDTSQSKEKDTAASSDNSGFKMNDKMFDMLKAMVPPEQKSAFENLSMLLNTMSYDNNSKPDESKELK